MTKVFQVPVVFDLDKEGQENIALTLSSPTGGAALGAQSTAKLALIDYTADFPTVYVSDAKVIEGDSGTKAMNFTLTLTPANKPVTVYYQTSDGSALANVDYQPINTQVVFSPGDAPKTISIPVIGDTVVEPTKVFYVVVSGVVDGSVTKGTGEGTIFDNDAPAAPKGCIGGTTIAKPRITITGLGDQAGNERINFRGKLKFAAGSPANMTPLDALGHGAQIPIEDLGSGGAAVFDLSEATDPVPAGASAETCVPGKLDGWRVNPTSTAYVYRNASGALAPGCASDSAHGLSLVRLNDRRSQTQKVVFNVKSRATTIAAPVGPLRGTIILGADAADGLAGRCGSHTFDALDCALDQTGTKFLCH